MAVPLLFLPLLVLSVGFFALANDCNSYKVVQHGENKTIKTEDAGNYEEAKEIDTTVYVRLSEELLQGLDLTVTDEHGNSHNAPFRNFSDVSCLPQGNEWGEMKMGVKIFGEIEPYHVNFWVRYGGCIKGCEQSYKYYPNSLPSPRSLSVTGYGPLEWKDTMLKLEDCPMKPVTKSTTPQYLSCHQPSLHETQPKFISTSSHPTVAPSSLSTTTTASTTKVSTTKTTPTITSTPSITAYPHPHNSPSAHKGRDTTGSAVVVVAWLMGMVTVVTIVVVTVGTVWLIWQQGLAPSYVIRDTP